MVVNIPSFIVLLLSLWRVDVCKADVMDTSVLQKGKHCIQAAREAYEVLMRGDADKATTSGVVDHLEALTGDAKYLQSSAEHFLDNLVAQETDLTKRLQQLQKEKGQFEMEIETFRKEKTSIEGSHAAKESVLRDNENLLQRVQRELKAAEDKLQKAKKKLKKKFKGIGKAKKAVGKLVGYKSAAEKKVKASKKNLERQKSELQSAKAAATKTQQELSAIQNKIQQQESKIQATQQQVSKVHDEIGLVKSSIVLLRKSVNFWELFVTLSESAEARTVSLKRIVDLATEEGDYELLKEDGTITKAKSFIEAWDIIATDRRIQ